MCGIVGVYSFQNDISGYKNDLNEAISSLSQRGPDANGVFLNEKVALGHTRLSIIDTSEAANQPMFNEDKNFAIVYNGEIYNFKIIKEDLIKKGVCFRTNSDTEAVLKSYIYYGVNCMNKFNGFFSFAIYDKNNQSLFITRDRIGIKPLFYYFDDEKLIFGSELKALLKFKLHKEIDCTSLSQYLQLTYIPYPNTIFKNIKKLEPGSYLYVKNKSVEKKEYYQIPAPETVNNPKISYEDQKKSLFTLIDNSVKKRLIADVPLGAFLSGGIDSSVIVALASRHTKQLNTFSIGYKDEPYFDETNYANLVAKKCNTNHTVFKLSNDDFYQHLFDILNYFDEPFADSSAIAVYILSKHTRKHVKVALSGDGADELFAGYNKHFAEYMVQKKGLKTKFVSQLAPIWKMFPKSRNNPFGNKIRQLHRFSEISKLNHKERYWFLCCFMKEQLSLDLIKNSVNKVECENRKNNFLCFLSHKDLNYHLYTDMKLVLPNDMLTKVDMMSMANGLEVRVPFLDHEVVNFVFTLPSNSKIDSAIRKKILQDTFRELLPSELYNRPKHGFEVPLLKWFKNELQKMIFDDLLSDEFVLNQGIFDLKTVQHLKQKLFSNNPEDSVTNIWSMIVFQYWYKKYFIE